MLPTSLTDITLLQWIAYIGTIAALDEELKEIIAKPDSNRKKVLLTKNYVAKAYATVKFFEGDVSSLVDDVLTEYEAFCSLFNAVFPVIELTAEDITFGQFVDAKMIMQAGKDRSQWDNMQYILSIFAFPDYDPKYLNEGHQRFKDAGEIKMPDVISYSKWWDALNTHINDSYTVFQDSGEDEGANMKQHMERWGWVNFQKSIATTKVFDKAGSGLNSIECARATDLDTVLVWASEAKDYSIAVMRDMQK